jgi:hypothetical protein
VTFTIKVRVRVYKAIGTLAQSTVKAPERKKKSKSKKQSTTTSTQISSPSRGISTILKSFRLQDYGI